VSSQLAVMNESTFKSVL